MVNPNTVLKFFLVAALYCTAIFAQDELSAEKIYEKVDNSVVVVLAYDNLGNEFQGSGVVIDKNGLVATNHHVCKDASRIEIKHYSKIIKNVQVYLYDAVKDILILKTGDYSFTPLVSGNSDNLKAGQRVYAVGSPEGYENSISEGIISGFRNDENFVRLIQMTCPITDGSSGGAVLNSKGELIGLSVSGQHEGNLYFAIPINDVFALLNTSTPVTETNTSDSEQLFENGTLAIESKNYTDAEIYFSKHLEKFSNDVNAYYNRGYARFKLKEYNEAISDFSAVLDKNGTMESYFYRGNCYYSLKDYEKACDDYTKASEQQFVNPEVYFNRGYANYRLKNFREAVNDWNKAIELYPDFRAELEPKINIALEEQTKINK
jgi:TolA-binding protein